MKLTEYERGLLSGAQGKAKQTAMEIVCRMGELYGAAELLEISRAHLDGCSYTAVWDGGLEFMELLASQGGRVAVPTSLNIASCDGFCGKDFGNPEDFTEKCRRMEAACYQMGCIPSWTCASYQCCNIPAFGECVAFAESNVVNFCNSVFGARTERTGDLVDICCALTGRVPAMGLYLKENRYGTKLYDVRGLTSKRLEDTSGFAALGYLIGATAGNLVPVVDGFGRRITQEELKALSAASAASGPVGLFHVVGTTPEAPDLRTATGGREVKETVTVTDALLEETFRGLSEGGGTAEDVPVDLVVLGCPHLSFGEFCRAMDLLGERRVSGGLRAWFQTSDAVYRLLSRIGMVKKAERAGIKIMWDSCIMNQPMDMWGFRNVVVNSGKMAHYAPGNLNANVYFRDMRTCVETMAAGRLVDQR